MSTIIQKPQRMAFDVYANNPFSFILQFSWGRVPSDLSITVYAGLGQTAMPALVPTMTLLPQTDQVLVSWSQQQVQLIRNYNSLVLEVHYNNMVQGSGPLRATYSTVTGVQTPFFQFKTLAGEDILIIVDDLITQLGQTLVEAIAVKEHVDEQTAHVDGQLTAATDAKNAAITAKTASESARDASVTAKTASEAAKTASESARDASVTAKTASESARDASVTAKTASEAAKTASESARDASVTAKTASEAAKTAAETARDASVTAKTASEAAKTASESARDTSVTAKTASESARDLSVTAKTASESAKTASESARDASVTAKTASEAAKTAAESARDAAITAKTAAESARDTSVTARTASEAARDGAVTAKSDAELARDASVTAKTASESARDASVTAKTASEAAKNAAESARDTSVTAKTAAESARDASVTAKTASESARDASVTAKTAAETARDTATQQAAIAQQNRFLWRGTWVANQTTLAGDGFEYLGTSYRRKTDGNTGAAFTAGDYDVIGKAGSPADLTRTSTSSLAIGTGAKSFTFPASSNLGWAIGTRLRATVTTDVASYLEGVVTAVTASSVTILVDLTAGTGTFASWSMVVVGMPGTLTASAFPDAASFDEATDNIALQNGSVMKRIKRGKLLDIPSVGTPAVAPTLMLDFANSRFVAPRVIHTRSGSGANRYNALRKFESVGANIPRIDYSRATGKCLGLLGESGTTNYSGYSVVPSMWGAVNATKTDNVIAAPDGSLAPTWTNTPNQGSSFFSPTTTGFVAANNTDYTYSFHVYVVSATNSGARRVVTEINLGSTNSFSYAAFDLATLTASKPANISAASIEDVGDGWYRCIVTFRTDAAGSAGVVRNYIGGYGATPETATVSAWGAQLEPLPFATTLVPNTGITAVVRNPENPRILTDASWFNAREGTIIVDAIFPATMGSNNQGIISFNDGSMNNRLEIRPTSYNTSAAGVAQATPASVGYAPGVLNRFALSYKAGKVSVSRNGSAVNTAATATIPTVTQLSLCSVDGGNANGRIWLPRLEYYPIQFSDSLLPAYSTI